MPVKIIGPGFSVSASGKDMHKRADKMVDEIIRRQQKEREEQSGNPTQILSQD